MASDFLNQRRKSPQDLARYQQLASRPARSDASPLVVREPGGKAAKAATRGADALRARPAAGGRGPWALLGLAAFLLAVLVGLAFVLFPSNTASDPRPTSATAQRQSDARPSGLPSAVDHAHDDLHGEDGKEIPGLKVEAKDRLPETPFTWEQLRARGEEHVQARRWREAATDFAAALDAHPNDHLTYRV